MTSFGIDFGWVGFGVEGGLLPNVRLGVVRFWCCRGSMFDLITRLNAAMTEAAMELGKLP
jgi:hypothetical protein